MLSLGVILLGGGLLMSGCATKPQRSVSRVKNSEVAAHLRSFVAEKEAQANVEKMPSEVQAFFKLAAKGDWQTISNAFIELRQHARQSEHSYTTSEPWRSTAWQAVVEVWGAFKAFGEGDARYSVLFGTNVIASIPPGSIYFGGTDAGRFIITALQKSHVQAKPFFTLSQTSLADARYLEYLRGMYGTSIHVPTDADLRKAFGEYAQDAAQRRSTDQLRPGESTAFGAGGEVQTNSMMAVVQVKGLLAQWIFDKNPDRACYIEESFPFDWLFPHLEPHGLIFKINHQPLPGLTDEMVQRDHHYWRNLVRLMIGDWLTDDTSVEEVAASAKRTLGQQDFSGFTGDRRFVQNAYSRNMFSKLRSSLGGLYAWRMRQATDSKENERMGREADFAFRQAWALSPDSIETIFRYVAFLMEQKRVVDALEVAETAAQMPSLQGHEGQGVRQLVDELKRQASRK